MFPATADYFGRKRVVVITMTIFTAFSVGVAASKNIGEWNSRPFQGSIDLAFRSYNSGMPIIGGTCSRRCSSPDPSPSFQPFCAEAVGGTVHNCSNR